MRCQQGNKNVRIADGGKPRFCAFFTAGNRVFLWMRRQVYGNTAGIRDSVLAELEGLYDVRLSKDVFLSAELCEIMSALTGEIGREIMVYLSRQGTVEEVRIGDDHTVGLTEMRLVRNIDRLSGVRCVHTHPEGSGMLSDVDRGSLSALRLDSMVAIGVRDGKPLEVYAGFIGEMENEERKTLLYGPYRHTRIPDALLLAAVQEADDRLNTSYYAINEIVPDRAVLLGIESDAGYDSMEELAQLCQTAGIKVVARSVQRNRTPDAGTYIGTGKAEEAALLGSAAEADIYVFDDELTAIQMRNLEQILGLPIIDRTMLILDIFAQRAQSREGKLQVELAQLQYRLPRLSGMGRVLSRQGSSGVGMRGPGEKKLEIDRRRIRRRIFELSEDLREVEKQRDLRRGTRNRNPVPLVALVGYTNAGKSTLLNALSGADALVEDKLFATLDPLVRKIALPDGTECLLSDTVGFINKLPHDLVNAFRSTLEEVRDADLILHVVDASSPYADVQIRVVEEVLGTLEALDTPSILVYNKIDLLDHPPQVRGQTVCISAARKTGLDLLLKRIEEILQPDQIRLELLVPYDRYEAMQTIRKTGTVLSEQYETEGTRITALLPQSELWRIKKAMGGDDIHE